MTDGPDDEIARLRERVRLLSLALAEAAGEAERWRPKQGRRAGRSRA